MADIDLTFPRRGTDRPQLVRNARESLLAKAAKCNDPNNLEWSWDDRDKYERHAMSAVLDLVAAEEKLTALARKLIEAVEVLGGKEMSEYNKAIDAAVAQMRNLCAELGVNVDG